MFEAFAIAVRVHLIDGMTPGLLGLSHGLMGAQRHLGEFETRLQRIRRLAAVGTGLMGLGAGILYSFKPALDEAKKFQTEVARFSLYGMGDAATSEAAKFAKSMNVMGSSYTENMKLINEAQGVFRESGKLNLSEQLEGAKIAAPILAKLSFIESGLSEDLKASRHAQDLAMLRFIESRGGANDPRTFAAIADWGFKLSKSSGGIVDWQQLQRFTATAGAAGFNLTQDAIAKLEPVIADLKGEMTGSGMRVAFQRLLGTQRGLPKQAIQEYLSLGAWDPSKVQLSKSGQIEKFLGRPGDVLNDREKFASAPVDYYMQNFLPMIAKKYGAQILGDSVEAKVQRAAEITMFFGPGTAGSVFSQIDKLMPAIQRSVGAQNKQLGIDPTAKIVAGTFAGKEVILHKKFNDLLEATGEVVLPIAVAGLNTLLPLLTKFSAWTQHHPGQFAAAIKGLAGLGALSLAAGAIVNMVAAGQALKLLFDVMRVAGPLLTEAPLVLRFMSVLARFVPLLMGGFEALVALIAGISAPVWLTIAAGAALIALVVEVGRAWDQNRSVFGNIIAGVSLFFRDLLHLVSMLPGLHGLDPYKPGPPTVIAHPDSKTSQQLTKSLDQVQKHHDQNFWGMAGNAIGGVVKNAVRYRVGEIVALSNTRWFGRDLKSGDAGYVAPKLTISSAMMAAAARLKPGATGEMARPRLAPAALAPIGKPAPGQPTKATTQVSVFVPAPRPTPVTINLTATTNLDGREIARKVTAIQAHDLSGPRVGVPRADPRATLAPVAAGYAR